MTPKRKEYLMEHTGKEATIRHLIRAYKHELKKYKAVCSSYDLKRIGSKPFGYRIHIVRVKETKLVINALRHELAKLKGYDRVVMPKVTYIGIGDGNFMQRIDRCTCGERLMGENYCPECGRKILWEEV